MRGKKMNYSITFDTTWEDTFFHKLENDGPWSDILTFQLAYEAIKNTSVQEKNTLVSIKHLPHLQIYPHQLATAKQVIEDMHGKAILADEVGLGKTIEAGLILKEYMMRGRVSKALILVPASLVSQWVIELNQKFFIPAVAPKKNPDWGLWDIVVSSLDTAKRSPNQEMILEQNYDLIIIDEAHKLKNPKTKNYEFVQKLHKKYCLLLTATPIQNKIEEIYHLISLLKPGHLGSSTTFIQNFRANKRCFTNDAQLQALVKRVMIRNRRQDTEIQWTKRKIHNEIIVFSQEEREVYTYIQNMKHSPKLHFNPLSLLTLEREACSSKEAVYMTLQKWIKTKELNSDETKIIEQLIHLLQRKSVNMKAEKALEIIRKTNDKVIIFTGYQATQYYLQWFFQQHHLSAIPFRGGFKRGKKDWMKELFQTKAQILIATEAGSEGMNLQFCHVLINFDLPWNPMRLEQRIGRIHRLGQKKDVHIYNFATQHTVEEKILQLLYEKIEVFKRVVGELDEILARFEGINFEAYLSDALAHSNSEQELDVKINILTEIINDEGTQHQHEQRYFS